MPPTKDGDHKGHKLKQMARCNLAKRGHATEMSHVNEQKETTLPQEEKARRHSAETHGQKATRKTTRLSWGTERQKCEKVKRKEAKNRQKPGRQ